MNMNDNKNNSKNEFVEMIKFEGNYVPRELCTVNQYNEVDDCDCCCNTATCYRYNECESCPVNKIFQQYTELTNQANLDVRVKRIDDTVILPKYETPNSAGMDIRAYIPNDEYITIRPNEIALIKTGLFMEIPIGYECQIRPRSGLAFKNGITLISALGHHIFKYMVSEITKEELIIKSILNSNNPSNNNDNLNNILEELEDNNNALIDLLIANNPGTIDADYRGEVGVILVNMSDKPFVVGHNDKIAQMVFAKVEQAVLQLPMIEVESTVNLTETVRGDGGFGHTGVSN